LDTESEREAQFHVETEDEERSILIRLRQNQQYMDQQIIPPSGENSVWILERQPWQTTEGTNVVLIRKPIGMVDGLAALLDTP
jgi:hypothetical protein